MVHPQQFRSPVPVSCPEMPHPTEGGTPSGGALEKSTPPYQCPSHAAGSPTSTGQAEREGPVLPPRSSDCTGGPLGLPEGALPFSQMPPSLQTQVEAIINGTMVEWSVVGVETTCEAHGFLDEVFEVLVWGAACKNDLHCPNCCPCYGLHTQPVP